MLLRTLIVDDEPIARRVLREELELIDGIEVVGEADGGTTALKAIQNSLPDLVLLDLQMPGVGGFEVVRALSRGKHLPLIVIVTAYDEYAIQAFEAGAIDYLLKPVSQDRLAAAIDRARHLCSGTAGVAQHLARLQEIAEDRSANPRKRKIVAKTGQEYLLLDSEEVFAFQAEGDLVWIVTASKRYLATQTLRALQERLRNTNFRRVHRAALVNMDHVRKMSTLSSQRWLITLTNGLEFIVSKRLAHNIRQLLT
ncbi:MAG: response regulator transcription factor [Acidobacteriaceae bacterium]|nr:response regulator transcription factor [Acidobacteriaceae bacterium]